MVIALKNGQQYKLEPNDIHLIGEEAQLDMIERFIVVFKKNPLSSGIFSKLKGQLEYDISRPIVDFKEAGFKDLDSCFRRCFK